MTTAAHTHAKDVSFTNRKRARECATQTHLLKVLRRRPLDHGSPVETHPTRYVAAIMSDTPLAQAHHEASDEAALPVRCCAGRGDQVAHLPFWESMLGD